MISPNLKLPSLTYSCLWAAISFIEGRTLLQEWLLPVAVQGQTVQYWNLIPMDMFPDCLLKLRNNPLSPSPPVNGHPPDASPESQGASQTPTAQMASGGQETTGHVCVLWLYNDYNSKAAMVLWVSI